MAKYSNIISLGYFCSIALDLEKMGLRSMSLPFDWVLSNDFSKVIYLIENHFKSFMLKDNLYQMKIDNNWYFDIENDISFLHDFTNCKTLDKQYAKVKEKYDRRIKYFYEAIKKPTLFIRYIKSPCEDNKFDELKWIEDNFIYIQRLLTKFNPDNKIIFIANDDVQSDIIKLYNVKKDENDSVARSPLYKNKDLEYTLNSIDFDTRIANIEFYKKKTEEKAKPHVIKRIKNKVIRIFAVKYIHDKQI